MDCRTIRKRVSRLRLPAAFTLVELLTVIAIIALLVGMMVGVFTLAKRKSTEGKMRAEIKTIETALEAYKNDSGGYPPLDVTLMSAMSTNFPTDPSGFADGWTNSVHIYEALTNTESRVHMSFSSNQVRTVNGNTIIIDPLGNPYGYTPRIPQANPSTFDLWSAGWNKISAYPAISSTNDDIGNWH